MQAAMLRALFFGGQQFPTVSKKEVGDLTTGKITKVGGVNSEVEKPHRIPQTDIRSSASVTSPKNDKNGEMIYSVKLMGLRNKSTTICLCNTEEQMRHMTVLQLKSKIADKLPEGVDIKNVQLIFTSKMLGEDSTRLSSYGIQNQSIIQFVLKAGQKVVQTAGQTAGQKDKGQLHQVCDQCLQGLSGGAPRSDHCDSEGCRFRKPQLFKVIVKGLLNKSTIIELCDTEEQMRLMKVLQLKMKIATKLNAEIRSDMMRLIFGNIELEEDRTLSSYGIKNQSIIHNVIKVSGG